MSQLRSFANWQRDVDRKVEAVSGMSADDLPDICYRDLFDDEVAVDDAAEQALENAGFPMELSF